MIFFKKIKEKTIERIKKGYIFASAKKPFNKKIFLKVH